MRHWPAKGGCDEACRPLRISRRLELEEMARQSLGWAEALGRRLRQIRNAAEAARAVLQPDSDWRDALAGSQGRWRATSDGISRDRGQALNVGAQMQPPSIDRPIRAGLPLDVSRLRIREGVDIRGAEQCNGG